MYMEVIGAKTKINYTLCLVEQKLETTPIDQAVLNSIKDKMAQAYLMSLNGAVNYALDGSGRDHDGIGIDYTASNATIGEGRRATLPINQMNIQLKGVGIDSTKVEITDTHVKYKMSKSLSAVGRHYLFVIVLPENEKLTEWCMIEPERIILNARGFFFKVIGVMSAGTVQIPIENSLTVESYKALFEDDLPVEFSV